MSETVKIQVKEPADETIEWLELQQYIHNKQEWVSAYKFYQVIQLISKKDD